MIARANAYPAWVSVCSAYAPKIVLIANQPAPAMKLNAAGALLPSFPNARREASICGTP